MDIKNVKREDGKLSFQVLVDAASFESAVNNAYLKAKKSIYVPGFRKGKAPRMVIEGMYGAKVFYDDAVDSIALDAFKAGMEEAKDRTVGDPAITAYNVDDDKCLTIDFEAALYPEVTLGQYKGLEAEKESDKVSAADVNKELESVRKRNARIVTVERKAKMGDTVNLDYDGYKDGVRFDGGKAEGHDLVLGSNSFVPGFEAQIVGMSAGEEHDIDITFPENYHADLAGAAVVFKIKVNEVKESQLPALDDEFAKDVSEFDTLEELKADTRAKLEKTLADAKEYEGKDKVLQQVYDANPVELPQAMIDSEAANMLNEFGYQLQSQGLNLDQYCKYLNKTQQQMIDEFKPDAEKRVKSRLIVEAVAKQEGVEVTQEDIDKELAAMAAQYGMAQSQIKSIFGEENMDYLKKDIMSRKAIDLMYEAAEITEVDEKPAEEAKDEE